MTDFKEGAVCAEEVHEQKNELGYSSSIQSSFPSNLSVTLEGKLTRESCRKFRENALKNGFINLIRVPTGKKAPVDKHWITGNAIEKLLNPSNDYLNTGLLCSGFRVIDVDVPIPKKALEIGVAAKRILGPIVGMRCRGNSSKFAIIYRAVSGKPKKRFVGIGDSKVEVLGDGQQLIVHGLHPSGLPYIWRNDKSLENIFIDNIPTVTEEQISDFLEKSAHILGCSSNEKNIRNIVANQSKNSLPASRLSTEENGGYFHLLSVEDQNEFLPSILKTLQDKADAPYPEWLTVIMACHASGATNSKEIAREWSKSSEKYDEAVFEKTWGSLSKDRPQGITVGTLIKMARERGLETRSYWTKAKNIKAKEIIQLSATVDKNLRSIEGGFYEPEQAMRMMDARYVLVSEGGQLTFFKICLNGHLERTDERSLKTSLANAYVIHPSNKNKSVPIFYFWLKNPERPSVKTAVFKPSGQVRHDEFNFYRGFGVIPQAGRDKIRNLLKHIWKIICQKDGVKFKYLVRWLSWGVQNPDYAAEVAVVIKSSKEGGGKSTLSKVMLDIYGSHGKIIDDCEQLLGKHADNENILFIAVEEAFFAGDPKNADKIKSRLTAQWMIVERKYQMARQVSNRIKAILTTNHEWAIPAGEEARRWFVVEASNEVVGKRQYFDALNSDLTSGGDAQFLNFLLNINLKNWHPRNVPKTIELAQQQIMSAQPVERWLLSCADNGQIPKKIGAGDWWYLDLGMDHATTDLYRAFCDSQQSGRDKLVNQIAFGVSLTKILGKNRRLTARSDKNVSRPMGYFIPDATTLRNKVFETLGLDIASKAILTPVD